MGNQAGCILYRILSRIKDLYLMLYKEFQIRSASNEDIPSIKAVVFGVLEEYQLKYSEAGKDNDLSNIEHSYFNNAGYSQTTSNGNNQNVKQTKVKNYRALITYDESKGYTLLVQLGQSSPIVWECVNFATEQDVMNAANAFDIDGIKKMLGEQ